MRGHWESTTRKLNKHYQSSRKGQGGVIPPVDPFRLTFGDFYTGGKTKIPMFSIPEAGEIPVYPSGYGETYSFMYEAAGHNHGGIYSQDFAVCSHLEGLRNLEHNIWVVPISSDNYDQYSDPSSSYYENYLRAQELYAEGKAARVLDTQLGFGSIWKLYRERYIKFNFPERFYSPCFNKDVVNTFGGGYIRKGYSEFPFETKFELTAKSCKAGAFPSVNYTLHQPQTVTIAQYNYNNTRVAYTTLSIGYSDVVSIYDKELAGESYVELTISAPDSTFYLNNDRAQGYRTDCRKARIYCFIHDNSYYVEQVAHIYDSNDNEITDVVVNLDYFNYPVPLHPYFLNPAFVQPHGTNPNYPDPIFYSTALNDGTFDKVSFNYQGNGPLVEHYITTDSIGLIEKNFTFSQPTALGAAMMVHFLSETEFWNKHNEWCNEHGGTPYVPPVVTQ